MGRANDLICLITLPDSYVLAIEAQKNSCCFQIFDEVCDKLNILQKDFFGLKLKDKNGARWLNLRNPLSLEVNCSGPVKLNFSIKYFVQPHHLLQDSTRDAFFKITRSHFISEQFNVVGEDFTNDAASILYHCSDPKEASSRHALPPSCFTESRLTKIKAMASTLHVSSTAEARRLFLKKMTHCMSTVGHRYSVTFNGARAELCVLRNGLAFLSDNLEIITNHPWSAIRQATHNGCEVTIHFTPSDSLLFILKNKVVANAFYRDLTEVYTFFHCDAVDGVITDQTCRDLKGTIASLFNENSNLGKAYVFDIEHTLKEMSDFVRRHIYHQEVTKELLRFDETNAGKNTPSDEGKESSCDCKAREYLNELRELFTCALCIENLVDSTFIPCGHVFCCMQCSTKINQCPLCKGPINTTQHIYLPTISNVSIA